MKFFNYNSFLEKRTEPQAATPVVMTKVNGELSLFYLEEVSEITMMKENQIYTDEEKEYIMLRDEKIIVHRPSHSSTNGLIFFVILESNGEKMAIAVDEFIGQDDLLFI